MIEEVTYSVCIRSAVKVPPIVKSWGNVKLLLLKMVPVTALSWTWVELETVPAGRVAINCAELVTVPAGNASGGILPLRIIVPVISVRAIISQ